ATEAEIRCQPRGGDHDHQEDGERAVPEGPFREVGHGGAPSRRTFWPGWSACTPAVTTISPPSRPWETSTVAGSKRSICTLCSDTVIFSGSASQSGGWPVVPVSRAAGRRGPGV